MPEEEGIGMDAGGFGYVDTASAGLASLDVRLPAYDASRWTRYLFTKPRGDVAIKATALSGKFETALTRAGLALVVLFVLGGLFALVRAIGNHRAPTGRQVARTLAFSGLIGILIGILPLLGLLALLASPIVALTTRHQTR